MRDLIILLVHLITTVFQLVRPGGLRSVLAESVLIKHQLLIVNRSRRRAPNLVKPGPKGPNSDVIRAVVDMKQRNPTWGCPRIAEQISLAFGIPI